MEKTMHATVSLLGTGPALNSVGKEKAQPPRVSVTPTGFFAGSGDVVRRVTISEYKQAALCLAEAFADDDVCRYFTHTPDRGHLMDSQQWKLHLEIMEYITYAHILKGLVLAIGPGFGCVALWMPPGENMDDYLTIMRSGMWRLYYKLSADGKTRLFDEFFPLLHDTKQEVMGSRDNDSWYLVYLGTRATARGKGYARKLVEYVTSMADFEGRACYLESSNPINPAIYRKLGFEIAKTIELGKHELDIMVREPAYRTPCPPVLEKVDSMFTDPQLSVTTKIGNGKAAHASLSLT